MAARFELNDGITEALATSTVRRGIDDVADGILPRAASIASSAGADAFARGLFREDGIRPGTEAVGGFRRPFARVGSRSEGAEAVEHGDVGVTRQSILARATGGSS